VFEILSGHPGAVIGHANAGSPVVLFGQRNLDMCVARPRIRASFGQKAINRIVNELGEASPLRQVDFSQHREDSR